MTPEERAERLAISGCTHNKPLAALALDCLRCIAAEIRAAVEEAYEQAAWGAHRCKRDGEWKMQAGIFCNRSSECWPKGVMPIGHGDCCRAAVEEEREACARVAESHRYFEITDPETGEVIGGDIPDAMRRMMDWTVGKTVSAAIRARSTAQDAPGDDLS